MASGNDPVRSTVPILIALLCAAALVTIALLLGGSDVNETGGKAIGLAATCALFMLTGVTGISLAQRRPGLSIVGYLTVLVSLGAFLAVNAAIWANDIFSDSWRTAAEATVLAIAAANVSLLLGSAREGDSEALRVVRAGAMASLAALCVMAIVEISSRGEDIEIQAIAIAAVLYLLGMALLPLLRRLSPPAQAEPPPTVARPAPAAGARVLRIDHVVIAVGDLDRSNAFYRDVLGAELVSTPEGRTAYRIGGQQLSVHAPGAGASPLAAAPVVPGNTDLCFIWNGAIATAVEHLQRHDVEIVQGPVRRLGAHGLGQSVYCRDPDGSLIELISYE